MGKLINDLYKDAWSAITAYTIGDIVTSNGSSYICIANNLNHEPPNATYWGLLAQAGTTDGDVNGPASSTDNNFPLFNGTTGKLLKDGGIALVDEDMMTSNSAVKVPTQQSVKAYVDLLAKSPPQGFLINGKIVISEASNNLTVTIKTLAGNNPSSSDPVYVRIENTVRTITSALSVTKNAGTNWFNAGSSELATQEIDYFVYLGYNATDGVVIGFSRIPYAKKYDDFSTTSTNEKYAAISTITNAASTDYYENIGRFAATLSAGAGYTWSVPTFTAENLIQKPIHETRWLDWVPTHSASGSMTISSPVNTRFKYKIINNILYIEASYAITTGGTASNKLLFTLPFSRSHTTSEVNFGCGYVGDGSQYLCMLRFNFTSANQAALSKYNEANWTLIGITVFGLNGFYSI